MEVLDQRATKVRYGLQGLLKKTEIIQQQYPGEMIVGLQDVVRDLTENEGEMDRMIQDIHRLESDQSKEKQELEDKIRILEEKVKSLEDKVTLLQKENAELTKDNEDTKNELKELKTILQVGQLAYNFENDLAIFIYPKDEKFGSYKKFTTLMEWLDDEQDTEEWRDAKAKWEDLRKKFSWSERHKTVFLNIIKSRIKVAHPPVVRKEIQFMDSLSENEKKCIEDMYLMTKEVNTLMKPKRK